MDLIFEGFERDFIVVALQVEKVSALEGNSQFFVQGIKFQVVEGGRKLLYSLFRQFYLIIFKRARSEDVSLTILYFEVFNELVVLGLGIILHINVLPAIGHHTVAGVIILNRFEPDILLVRGNALKVFILYLFLAC